MADEISKKDLLAQTGISYGQLYRWKREGLIPEEWFVKRSAFTGQETYLPKAQVLKRVQTILELKDELSLEEIYQRIKQGRAETYCARQVLTKFDQLIKSNALTQLLPEHANWRGLSNEDLQALIELCERYEFSLESWSVVVGVILVICSCNQTKERLHEFTSEALENIADEQKYCSQIALVKFGENLCVLLLGTSSDIKVLGGELLANQKTAELFDLINNNIGETSTPAEAARTTEASSATENNR